MARFCCISTYCRAALDAKDSSAASVGGKFKSLGDKFRGEVMGEAPLLLGEAAKDCCSAWSGHANFTWPFRKASATFPAGRPRRGWVPMQSPEPSGLSTRRGDDALGLLGTACVAPGTLR
jgi:hypothetical protein